MDPSRSRRRLAPGVCLAALLSVVPPPPAAAEDPPAGKPAAAASLEPLPPLTAAAGEWPWWRGPDRDGKCPDPEAPPTRWSKVENVLWRAEVPGRGHASPVVARDRIFIATADETARTQSILCHDRETGKLLWPAVVHQGGFEHRHDKNSQASPTPAWDGERLFAAFLNDGAIRLSALDAEGKVLWQREAGAFESMHGYSSSPVLHGAGVIVTGDSSAGSFIAAFHRRSGDLIWKTPRGTVHSFSTPTVARVAGRPQLFLNGAERVASYDPDSGRLLWSVEGPTQIMASTMPAGPDLVLASGGFPEKEILCIRADGSGDVGSTHVVWRTRKGVTYVPSALHHEGRFYVVNDSGVVTCFEAATGREVWKDRLEGAFSASPILAGGCIYATNEAGVTHVFRTGDRFELVARNDLADGGFATPAACGGRIYLRTSHALYAIGKPPPAPEVPPGAATLKEFIERQVQEIGERSLARLATVDGPESWQRLRGELRRELKEMLGLEPEPPRGDLQATVTGVLERPDLGIAVEKLHFQSLPGLHVTAGLFRPLEPRGRLPAVLYLCGHGRVAENGVSYGNKAHYQHHGAWFARAGYVCLVVDTLQLGEIEGKHHGTYSLGMWWWPARGYTPAGVEAWGSIRALDYLESRPDVDAARIGVTGRSGGGVGTWWLAALDDRPAVLAPVAGITDLRNHLVGGVIDGHCDCNFTINSHRWDYTLVAALAAPRPLLFLNSDTDRIFPLDGVLRIHAALKKVYGAAGAADRLGLTITAGPHADTQELQVPAFRWLGRWLRDEAEKPVALLAEKHFAPKDLRVLDAIPAGERDTSIEESFVAPAPAREPPADVAAFEAARAELVAALKAGAFRTAPPLPAPYIQPVKTLEKDGLALEQHSLASEEPYDLPLWIVRKPGAKPARAVLEVLDEDGWEQWTRIADAVSTAGAAGAAAPAGRAAPAGSGPGIPDLAGRLPAGDAALALLAPRGIGPTRWSGNPKEENGVRRRFLALGRTVEEARVHDVRRALRAVSRMPELSGAPLWLEARGEMAAIALYAALLEEHGGAEPAARLAGLDLTDLPPSHRDAVVFPGVLRTLDIPQAAALLFPCRVVLRGVDPGLFAWTGKCAALFAPAGGAPPLEFAPVRSFLPARAHAIPEQTTSEGSGYFSIIEGKAGIEGKSGRLYIGTAKYRENAFLVEFDPAAGAMKVVVDAMKEIGSRAAGFAAQAKIHTRNNVGASGRIYFGTKQGYPKEGEKREDYPGGHPMVFDPASGTTRVYPVPVPHHGVVSVTPDESRGVAYISTCADERPVDSTHFLVLDLEKGTYRDLLDCRHMYGFIILDNLGRAYHPILGGEIARFDPRAGPEGRLERLRQTIDGRALPSGSLLAHPESHPINWDVSPDGKSLYAVPMNDNQLYAYDLTAAGGVLPGRSLGKLIAGARETDCRALCAGPKGDVWAAVTASTPESGRLLRLVHWSAGMAAPRDLGPLAVENPDYTAFQDADGKPLPFRHGIRRLDDGTMLPQIPMGICAARDGTVYVTVISPFTLLAVRPGATRN